MNFGQQGMRSLGPPPQTRQPPYSHPVHPMHPYPHPYPYPPPVPYQQYPPYSYQTYGPYPRGPYPNISSHPNMGGGPPPMIPPPSAPLRQDQPRQAPVKPIYPVGRGITVTGPPPPSTYLWNPRGPKYQTNPVSRATINPPDQPHPASHQLQNVETNPRLPSESTPNVGQDAHLPSPIHPRRSTESEERNNSASQNTATTTPARPHTRLPVQDMQDRFNFPPTRRESLNYSTSASGSNVVIPSSARDDAEGANHQGSSSSGAVTQPSQPYDVSAIRDPSRYPLIERERRVPPDTRLPHVRPLKSILRNSGKQEEEDRHPNRASEREPNGKGRSEEQTTNIPSPGVPLPGVPPPVIPPPAPDLERSGKERQQRTDNAMVPVSLSRQTSKSKGKERTTEAPPGWINPTPCCNGGYQGETGSAGRRARPPTPGMILRNPNYNDKFAPAASQHSHSSESSKSEKIPSEQCHEDEITLTELLSTSYPQFMAIEWDITLPLRLGKKRTQRGYDDLPVYDLMSSAVHPPVMELFVFTDSKHRSPVSIVFGQWGPIRIHPKRKDEAGQPTCVLIGDVLFGIHEYFSTRLTQSEGQSLDAETRERVLASRNERAMAIRRTDPGLAKTIASQMPVRADKLFGYFYFEALELDPDFSKTKTLYLKLRNTLGRQ